MTRTERTVWALLLLVGAALPVRGEGELADRSRADAPAANALLYYPRPLAREALREAVAAGLIPDPRTKLLRQGAPAVRPPVTPRRRALSPDDLFPYEDTASVLVTNFTDGQLLDLMADGANAVTAVHGDVYDFIGFWLAYEPHHEIGAAFYMPIFNDVAGIGDASTEGTPIFDDRAEVGLTSTEIEGYVMMWNINESYWQPGTAGNANFTRLALAQEFEHRYAMFLPSLLDGRVLQGIQPGCGRQFHWSWRVDGQGSGMEIGEWVGASPPVLTQQSISFNTDLGGVFSYTDLYLMGYVSPAEMDAGNSELRYMDDAACVSGAGHFGGVSAFSSGDIVASAGARVPDHSAEQQDYRTAWVMLHLPGQPPTPAQLNKAVLILEQHEIDWREGTLFRGTMDNSLQDPVAVPDEDGAPGGGIAVAAPAPNPSSAGVDVALTANRDTDARVTVHDVSGRHVATPFEGPLDPGPHTITWDGRSAGGMRVPPGVYFIRVADERGVTSSRVAILR